VVVALNVAAIVMAASKAVSVFFIDASSDAAGLFLGARKTAIRI
jgi:hypothetical protein